MKKRLTSMIAALMLLAVGTNAPALQTYFSFAAEVSAIDKSNISDDLKDVDLSDFCRDENGEASVIRFMESGYGQEEADSDYGLYVYIYNPTECALSEDAGVNVLNMAVRYGADGLPSDYDNMPLTLLDRTDNYRFCKFKITVSEAYSQTVRAYARTNGGTRRYDVVGIQLMPKDYTSAADAFDNDVSKTYRFNGYAKGFALDKNAESTLTCTYEGLDTVRLDVHYTYYRNKNANQNGKNHVNQINSVYFSVPKEKLGEYSGKLYSVKCRWNERRTAPVIVTNNKELNAEITEHLGKTVYDGLADGVKADLSYMIYDGFHWGDNILGGKAWADWAYNQNPRLVAVFPYKWGDEKTAPIGWVFQKNDKDITNAYVSQTEMLKFAEEHGYAEYLFSDNVDEGRTQGDQEHVFYADKPFDLYNVQSENKFVNWIDQVFGTALGIEQENLYPIRYVTDEDFTGNTQTDAERLYVHEKELADFQEFYNEKKTLEDVFLIRFAVTDYYSALQTVFTLTEKSWNTPNNDKSTYMARETVFLDFDVIYLDFWQEGLPHKIFGVISDPFNAIGGTDPPSKKNNGWWIYAVGAIVVLTLIGVIYVSVEQKRKEYEGTKPETKKHAAESPRRGKGGKT